MRRILDLLSRAAVLFAAAKALASGRRRKDAPTEQGMAFNGARPPTGRGRSAEVPSEIPARGWKDVAMRVYAEMKDDNLTTIAAAMTYYGVLALFPALIAVIALYGLLADPADVQAQIEDLADLLPASASEIVTTQVSDLAAGSGAALGLGFVVSMVAALWSVSSGVAALTKAINLAYDETETRSFVKLRILALGLTLGLVLFVIVAVFVITALPAVLDALGVSAGMISMTTWLRWPLLGLALLVALAAFYRWAPNRDPARWRWVTWGALFATIVWLAASALLNVYVSRFGSYNETYGTLGGVIVLLLWMFVSALIVLLGAELDSELEAQTRHDTTTGLPQPMGSRNAVKADELGRTAAEVDA